MSPLDGVSRRQFVASLGTVVGVALLPACGPSRETRELGGRLTTVAASRDAWRLVGEGYLEANPAERRLGTLTARLVEDLGWDPAKGSQTELAKSLAQRIRGDFREGRTVLVEGWVLSETEARIAAVVSLV